MIKIFFYKVIFNPRLKYNNYQLKKLWSELFKKEEKWKKQFGVKIKNYKIQDLIPYVIMKMNYLDDYN